MLNSCVSIWLKVNLNKLIKRYKKNDRRPLLNKKKLDTDVKKIYQSRKKIYSLANFKINCDNMSKTQIVEKILFFMKISRLKAKDYSIIIGKNSINTYILKLKNIVQSVKKLLLLLIKIYQKNFSLK